VARFRLRFGRRIVGHLGDICARGKRLVAGSGQNTPLAPEPTGGSVRPKQPIFSKRGIGGSRFCFCMAEENTMIAVQRYLDELAGDSPAEPIVLALLDQAVRRLHQLCATLLYRSYPRLTRPPVNLQADEMLRVCSIRVEVPRARSAKPVYYP
jgi:hypothetical protein